MNLNAIRRRIEALERIMTPQDGDEGCLLSPNDVALLMIERSEIEDTLENAAVSQRIDDLLFLHSRAANRLQPMTPPAPGEVHTAMLEAAEDPARRENRNKERLAELLAD